jgi:hypothetical protein
MKTWRTRQGPFAERPVYSLQEIESICSDELKKVNLYPNEPEPIRIERFIEKRFGITPVYENLPEGVLGFTRFGPKGVEQIVVAESLTDGTQTADRRISTTLAHEAGHGLLQAHLFVNGSEASSLFEGNVDSQTPTILCRPDAIPGLQKQTNYDGRWWEFQANQAIGALLLPKLLVEKCLDSLFAIRGSFGMPNLPAGKRGESVKRLSETFIVNPIVAKIRLDQLYPLREESQLTL